MGIGIAAGVLASSAHSTVTYTFTGIDSGIVEMAVFKTAQFVVAPKTVPAGQLGWCSIADSMAAVSSTCSSLTFGSDSINGVTGAALILTRDNGINLTSSTFFFSADTFGKIGTFRTIGPNMGILSVSGSAAPEPSTWMMLIAGFGLICLSCRRTRGSLDPAPAPAHTN